MPCRSARRATGRLMKKAHRQLVYSVNAPPASMPTAAPALVEGVGQPPAQQHDPAEAHVEAVPPR